MSSRHNEPIVLIEDDEIDALSVQDAFADIKVPNPLIWAHNAEEALKILQDDPAVKPLLILLDLNLPGMKGLEFLKIVKGDDNLKIIPIVVLTTSRHNFDKIESYKYGVAGYIIKPVNYSQFLETMRTINSYWAMSEFPE